MRRLLLLLFVLTPVCLLAGTAMAQSTDPVDDAAAALRRDPVYVDPTAERALSDAEADRLRQHIVDSGLAVFVAVLPDSAVNDDEEAGQLPMRLAAATDLSGTYAVVVGDRFRVASTTSAAADDLASAAFQARRDDGTVAVLEELVDRLAAEASGEGAAPAPSSGDDGDAGPSLVGPLVLMGGAGLGLYAWSRRRRRREEAHDQAALDADRMLLRGELAVLADDVLSLEPLVTTHPAARADYDAAVSRYRVAEAALDYADEPIDLVRVERVVAEASYAMSRARAIVEGRTPPDPPPDLRRPGRHDEPPLEVDDDGRPVYVGYGPFYGGGWFGGGGGGLLGGLLLGSMLGGWGWGGHVHVGDGGGDGGGFGGGGFGGGDWGGGGDVGGGDWG